MSKELKFGEYALMGKIKGKRIYLGFANGVHYAVLGEDTADFLNGLDFSTVGWESAEPIADEPLYYYKWEKMEDGMIIESNYMTDEKAKHFLKSRQRELWKRNDSTKREALK